MIRTALSLMMWFLPALSVSLFAQEETTIQLDFVFPDDSEYTSEDYDIGSLDNISLQYFVGDRPLGSASRLFSHIVDNDGNLVVREWSIPGVPENGVKDHQGLRVVGRVSIRGTERFPFSGSSGEFQEITVGEVNTFSIKPRFNQLRLPEEPAVVRLRVISSLGGIPLPGVLLSMRNVYQPEVEPGELIQFVTDENGEITVRVRRVSDGLVVRYRDDNHQAERLEVTVPREKLVEHASNNEALEIWTAPDFLHGVRLVHQDKQGQERTFPYDGFLVCRHPTSDNGSGNRSASVYLRSGLGALYHEAHVFPSLRRLKMAELRLSQSASTMRIDMENIRIDHDKQLDVPVYIIPLASLKPRTLSLEFTDEVTGQPIEEVTVLLRHSSGDESPSHISNEHGQVMIPDLPWDTMSLTVGASGYQSRRLILRANEDRPRLDGKLIDSSIPLIPTAKVTVEIDAALGEEVPKSDIVIFRQDDRQLEQKFHATADVLTDDDGAFTGHRFVFDEVIAGEGVIIFYGPKSEVLAMEPMASSHSGVLTLTPTPAEELKLDLAVDAWLSDVDKPPQKVVFGVMLMDMETFQMLPQRTVRPDGTVWWQHIRHMDNLKMELHTRRIAKSIGVIFSRQMIEEPRTNEYALIDIIDLAQTTSEDPPVITFSHDDMYQWFSDLEVLRHHLIKSKDDP